MVKQTKIIKKEPEESDDNIEIQDEPVKESTKEVKAKEVSLIKPKRVLNEKQREATAKNLAKGREALRVIKEEKRKQIDEAKALKSEIKEKSKEKLINTISKLKQKVEQPQEDTSSDEEEIVIKKAKSGKPKKKKVVIMESESDSDSDDEPPKRKSTFEKGRAKSVVNEIQYL
jgi:hypothetical protein